MGCRPSADARKYCKDAGKSVGVDEASKGATWTPTPAADVLELLAKKGGSRPRVLLRGSLPSHTEKAFAKKLVDMSAPDCIGDLELKVSFACKRGSRPNPMNQDNFIIAQAGRMSLYGVFDGHGKNGHKVSDFVATSLVENFARDGASKKDPAAGLRRAFTKANEDCRGKHFDIRTSGTTATVVLEVANRSKGRKLFVAHVGDSRLVLGRRRRGADSREAGEASTTEVVAEDLTEDHRPQLEAEKKRIVAVGGEVRKPFNDAVVRVFKAGTMGPGLGISRSIGDSLGQEVGVISNPDVRELNLQPDWLFVLACSDGVWDNMSSREAVEMVARRSADEGQQAAEELLHEAKKRWVSCNDDVDDITVLCIWF